MRSAEEEASKVWWSSDRLVKKEILVAGVWEYTRPADGSVCTIEIGNVSNESADSVYLKTLPSTITIGAADFHDDVLIERCVFSMMPREHALVRLYADNKESASFELKLVKFTPAPFIFDLSPEEKKQKALELKERGVNLFKANRTRDAYMKFQKALKYLVWAGDSEEYDPLYYVLCGNMSLCHIQQERPQDAITLTTKALEADPDNVKNLLRRASANNMIQEHEAALRDIQRALQLQPHNPGARQLCAETTAKVQAQRTHYVSLVKRMLQLDPKP